MKEKQLPESEIYESGLLYWPYKLSQKFVLDKIEELVPRDSCLLDVMCGPGNLLGRIKYICPDLTLIGVDIDSEYVQYGRKTYPSIYFEQGDILSWKTELPIDTLICTGALHHIPYALQEKAIANIASIAKDSKLIIISDCYIDHYANEMERKKAATKLGYEYIQETIKNGAPDEVIGWTIDILWNDVFQKEFKTSLAMRLPLLEKYFRIVQTAKTWPTEKTEYGDYVHICLPL